MSIPSTQPSDEAESLSMHPESKTRRRGHISLVAILLVSLFVVGCATTRTDKAAGSQKDSAAVVKANQRGVSVFGSVTIFSW